MLGQSEVDRYKSEGFCISPNFLLETEVSDLLNEVDVICRGATLADHDRSRIEMEPNQSPEGAKVRRIYEPCTYYDRFRELAGTASAVKTMVQLLGPDVLYFSSKINIKASEIGSVVEWHQDMAFGPLTNRSVVAVLIYLDDADTENGCLQVIPGHHRMLDHSHDGYFQGRITERLDTSKAIPLEGKRGTAIFFNGLAPHASAVNTSSRPRRTLILGYRAADAFPIHIGAMSVKSDQFVRLVHGKLSPTARFDMENVFIPRYPAESRSLYELQEQSRSAVAGESVSLLGVKKRSSGAGVTKTM